MTSHTVVVMSGNYHTEMVETSLLEISRTPPSFIYISRTDGKTMKKSVAEFPPPDHLNKLLGKPNPTTCPLRPSLLTKLLRVGTSSLLLLGCLMMKSAPTASLLIVIKAFKRLRPTLLVAKLTKHR